MRTSLFLFFFFSLRCLLLGSKDKVLGRLHPFGPSCLMAKTSPALAPPLLPSARSPTMTNRSSRKCTTRHSVPTGGQAFLPPSFRQAQAGMGRPRTFSFFFQWAPSLRCGGRAKKLEFYLPAFFFFSLVHAGQKPQAVAVSSSFSFLGGLRSEVHRLKPCATGPAPFLFSFLSCLSKGQPSGIFFPSPFFL